MGFYKTSDSLFEFYQLEYPQEDETKRAFKEKIFGLCWQQDLEWAKRNTCIFSKVFLRGNLDSTQPYSEVHDIIKIVSKDWKLCRRIQLTRIMRFWTAPVRPQKCECGEDNIDNLPQHIFTECRLNDDKVQRFLIASPSFERNLKTSIECAVKHQIATSDTFLEQFCRLIAGLEF